MGDVVNYRRPDDYVRCSASYQMGQVREYRPQPYYRPASMEGLHSAEYFIEQGERQLKRTYGTLLRCAVVAVSLVTIIYCIAKLI